MKKESSGERIKTNKNRGTVAGIGDAEDDRELVLGVGLNGGDVAATIAVDDADDVRELSASTIICCNLSKKEY